MTGRRSVFIKALLCGLAVGANVGGFMMHIGWEHNSMGEFHDENGVKWGYWLSLGAIWAVVSGAPVAVIAYAALRPWRFNSQDVG